jgi:hypothetical protein
LIQVKGEGEGVKWTRLWRARGSAFCGPRPLSILSQPRQCEMLFPRVHTSPPALLRKVQPPFNGTLGHVRRLALGLQQQTFPSIPTDPRYTSSGPLCSVRHAKSLHSTNSTGLQIHIGGLYKISNFATAVPATRGQAASLPPSAGDALRIHHPVRHIPRVMESIAMLASPEREEDQDHSMTRWASGCLPRYMERRTALTSAQARVADRRGE